MVTPTPSPPGPMGASLEALRQSEGAAAGRESQRGFVCVTAGSVSPGAVAGAVMVWMPGVPGVPRSRGRGAEVCHVIRWGTAPALRLRQGARERPSGCPVPLRHFPTPLGAGSGPPGTARDSPAALSSFCPRSSLLRRRSALSAALGSLRVSLVQSQ